MQITGLNIIQQHTIRTYKKNFDTLCSTRNTATAAKYCCSSSINKTNRDKLLKGCDDLGPVHDKGQTTSAQQGTDQGKEHISLVLSFLRK